jgi:hypothetical protein
MRELQLIAASLSEHEAEYSYLHQTHEHTINSIWQNVEALRRQEDDDNG